MWYCMSMNFSCASAGLLLAAVVGTAPAYAQSAPSLVTVTTNAPAVASQPIKPVFALKSAGIVKEVEKLTQSGTEPAVIKAFVQAWPTPYSTSADDILHLHEIGVPSDVLTTLIQHGAELGSRAPTPGNPNGGAVGATAPAPYSEVNAPTVLPPSPAPLTPEQYPPQATYPVDAGVYGYPTYPAYDYGYYDYPGTYYYPGVVIVGGIGFRGHSGFHGGRPVGGFGGHVGGFGGHGGGFGGHAGGVSGHGGGGGGHR